MKPAGAAFAVLAFVLARGAGCSGEASGEPKTATASAWEGTTPSAAPSTPARSASPNPGAAGFLAARHAAQRTGHAPRHGFGHRHPRPVPLPRRGLRRIRKGHARRAIQAFVEGTWLAGEYVAQSPGGEIQVVLIGDEVRLYVENWAVTRPYGNLPGTANIHNGIVIADGAIPDRVASFSDWPLGQPAEERADHSPAQSIAPGEAIYNGDYVCAGSEKGLTCWNVVTGHGAFVTGEGFAGFLMPSARIRHDRHLS